MADPAPNPGLAGAGAAADAAAPAKAVGNPCAACGNPPRDAPGPAPTPVAPLIWVQKPLVLVKKPYIAKPVRQRVQLHTDSAFDGTGKFSVTAGADKIKFFTSLVGGAEIESGRVFAGAALTAGVFVFAQGVKPSGAENDITIQLALKPGSAPVKPPATSQLTSVEVTLDICKSRTSPTADPGPLSVGDKIRIGRFVHRQFGIAHGRAMLIVRQTKPDKFTGILTLKPVVTGAATPPKIFPDGAEIPVAAPPAGKASLSWPREFPPASIPNTGLKFFIEGAGVSGGLRDIELQLGVKDVGDDGDHVKVTTVQFSDLRADIPVTPPHTTRLGNAPVRHALTHASGGPTAADFDVNVATNRPLVLLNGSVLAAHPINLSVKIVPAGVPVSWKAPRDNRPSPDGDHGSIKTLLPHASPKITGAGRTATLFTDAVGSFHVCPFVDCNGNGEFDFDEAATGKRIDREPFIMLNLVLVRVTFVQDDSVTHEANFTAASDGAGGIGASGGPFNINAPAGEIIHMNVQADLVGGGDDGLRGVDRVFAGWVNNETAAENIVGTFQDATVAPPVLHRDPSIFASNRGSATGANHTFLPADPPPAIVAPTLLDTGRGTPGTGGDSATLTSSRMRTRNSLRTAAAPAAVGQRILVEAIDSPGDGEGSIHPGFPAAKLVRFHFGLTFSASLCFWTNITGTKGDPADRLYSVLQRLEWMMDGEWTVNPATGAIAVVTAPKARITARTTFNPLAAAVTTPVEVRFPTGLGFLARDGRH